MNGKEDENEKAENRGKEELVRGKRERVEEEEVEGVWKKGVCSFGKT